MAALLCSDHAPRRVKGRLLWLDSRGQQFPCPNAATHILKSAAFVNVLGDTMGPYEMPLCEEHRLGDLCDDHGITIEELEPFGQAALQLGGAS